MHLHLLPYIIPRPVAREIRLLEKVILHGCLVDGHGGGEEAERQNDGEADARAQV